MSRSWPLSFVALAAVCLVSCSSHGDWAQATGSDTTRLQAAASGVLSATSFTLKWKDGDSDETLTYSSEGGGAASEIIRSSLGVTENRVVASKLYSRGPGDEHFSVVSGDGAPTIEGYLKPLSNLVKSSATKRRGDDFKFAETNGVGGTAHLANGVLTSFSIVAGNKKISYTVEGVGSTAAVVAPASNDTTQSTVVKCNSDGSAPSGQVFCVK